MNEQTHKQVQAQFLDACMKTDKPLRAIMDELKMIPRTLVSWLLEPRFRRRLNRVQKFLAKSRELDVQIGATRAAGVMLQAIAKDSDKLERAACVDLIKLARDSRARRKTELRDRRPAKPDYLHPDVDDETAAQLVKELDEGNEATGSDEVDSAA